MLNIWTATDTSFVQDFCSLHFSYTKQRLDPTRVAIFRSKESPYTDYDLLRLEISPHVVDEVGEQTNIFIISTMSISYVLYYTANSLTHLPVIPLPFGSATIYALNRYFSFQISRDNVSSYLILFGLISSRPPFYFFDRLSLIESMSGSGGPSPENSIKTALPTLFTISADGQLDISYTKSRLRRPSTIITARVPCLFKGALFVASLRISENGLPEMTEDLPLNITGLYDDEEDYAYYHLNMSDTARAIFTTTSSSERMVRQINILFVLNLFLYVFMIPVFLFQILLIFIFGRYNPVIFAYFNELRSSHVLTWLALLSGITLTIYLVARVLYIEVVNYYRKRTPHAIVNSFGPVEEKIIQSRRNMGIPLFLLFVGSELIIQTITSSTLLLYGYLAVLPVTI